MADTKFIPEAVVETQRLVYGPVAEAQALIELYRTANDGESIATLALSILERLLEAFHNYEHQLAIAGRPSAEECFPAPVVVPQ